MYKYKQLDTQVRREYKRREDRKGISQSMSSSRRSSSEVPDTTVNSDTAAAVTRSSSTAESQPVRSAWTKAVLCEPEDNTSYTGPGAPCPFGDMENFWMYQMDKQNEPPHPKEPQNLEQHWQDEVWTVMFDKIFVKFTFVRCFNPFYLLPYLSCSAERTS